MQLQGNESVAKRPRRTKAAPAERTAEPVLNDIGAQIAEAAYYLAAKRNFAPGHELDDWLQAEQMLRRID